MTKRISKPKANPKMDPIDIAWAAIDRISTEFPGWNCAAVMLRAAAGLASCDGYSLRWANDIVREGWEDSEKDLAEEEAYRVSQSKKRSKK